MCNETMLVDIPLFNSLRNEEIIRACTASSTAGGSSIDNTTHASSCLPKGSLTKFQEPLQLAFNKSSTPATLDDFEAASTSLEIALSQRGSNCTDITSFAYSNSVALGLFAGSGVCDLPASVLRQFITKIKSTGFSGSAVAQLCAKEGRSSRYSFGIAVSGDRDLGFVQDAVATWASGECITSYDDEESWRDVTLSISSLASNGTVPFGNGTAPSGNNTAGVRQSISNTLARRALCRTIKVVSGDSCEWF